MVAGISVAEVAISTPWLQKDPYLHLLILMMMMMMVVVVVVVNMNDDEYE